MIGTWSVPRHTTCSLCTGMLLLLTAHYQVVTFSVHQGTRYVHSTRICICLNYTLVTAFIPPSLMLVLMC